MLSTITAAETQFRHESESRARERALLASIRDRRAAEATLVSAALVSAAAPRLAVARTKLAAWPRPIGIKDYATTARAAA